MASTASRTEIDLATLFSVHGRRLYRLAVRLCRRPADAEDLVQETFVRAAEHPRRVPRDPAASEAWLVRVLVNLSRDRFRREATARRSAAALAAEIDDVPGVGEAVDARRDVTRALASLPPRRRAVVVLAELEELDTAAIARLLGIARVTVRWHLAAGRADLRRRLGVAPPEEGPR